MEIEWGKIFFMIISYLIFAGIGIIGWNKVREILEKRKEHIHDELNGAEQAKQDAEEVKAQLVQEREEFQAKVKQMTEDTVRQCEQLREDMMAKAKEEAEQYRAKAKQDVERERNLLWQQYRQEILNMSIILAQRAIQQNLSAADREKFNNSILDMLEKQNIGDMIHGDKS